MSDIFLYADETGNLDYKAVQGAGGSQFFGFGSAVFDRDHGPEIWNGMRLRAELSGWSAGKSGMDLRNGFHAVNDKHAIRHRVYDEILAQAPRFDGTFLNKKNAFPYVRARGEIWLYKYAFFLHLVRVAPQVARAKKDTLHVMVARLGTARRQKLVQDALEDVCAQTNMNIRLCVWDAATSWGLQVADYASWAMQRDIEMGDSAWFDKYVQPTATTLQFPWRR